MRFLVLASLTCSLMRSVHAQSAAEQEVRGTVSAFYKAFNAHNFTQASEFTAADWAQIRTFVLVKQRDRWRIVQDQNTIISR